MVPPVRERRPPVGRAACRLGTPTSGRHSGPQGRGGEDPNRRDGSRLGTYPQQMRRRGQARDRRPPVGSARRRRARGAVLLSAMAQIGPRITAQIRGVQDCAIRATGDSPLAALTGRVPTGGRRSKPSPRFLSVGGTPFRSPPASGAGPHRENWPSAFQAVPALRLSRRYAVSLASVARCRPEIGVPVPARRSAWWLGRHAPCSASAWRLLRLGERSRG